jgi:sugar O-acyltransferase (sialic acid O-acetyltransferase NeuD family)
VTGSLALVGAGGHGKVVLDALKTAGVDVWGVVDDDPATWNCNLLDTPVRGPCSMLDATVSCVAYGVGDNQARWKLADRIPVPAMVVVHPRAVVSSWAALGDGVVILASAVVQADARVRTGSIINTAAVVEHDCDVGAFAHVAPRATLSGGVSIGTGSLVGAGAVVLPGISIGKHSVIGAGAVVTSDVPDNSIVTGTPARPTTAT